MDAFKMHFGGVQTRIEQSILIVATKSKRQQNVQIYSHLTRPKIRVLSVNYSGHSNLGLLEDIYS